MIEQARPGDDDTQPREAILDVPSSRGQLQRPEDTGGSGRAAWYQSYLARCNAHDFDALAQFVAADVEVNGEVQGLEKYVSWLREVTAAFPDYRWNLRHLLVDGDWLSAHFIDTGTHRGDFLGVPATNRSIGTQEFAVYRVEADLIVEV